MDEDYEQYNSDSEETKPQQYKKQNTRRQRSQTPEEVPEFESLTDAQKTRLRKRAQNSALWHLERGDRSEHWLTQKLTKRGIPMEIIEETLVFLRSYGYVDDARYAKQFAASKRSSAGLSKRSLEWKLKRDAGIDSDLVEEALETITEEDEEEMAYELVAHKLRGGMRGVPVEKRFTRLVGMLSRKGYPSSIVFSVVKRALEEAEAEAEPELEVLESTLEILESALEEE